MVFQALTFLIGVFSVTPQILIPLAADLAPPERRASAIAMVLSGLLFGILIARVLAGIIADKAPWRVVYYMAIGLQSCVLSGCYLLIPDYPSKNDDISYFKILGTAAKYAVTEPILIQACLIIIGNSACFSNFWVTLTFLLDGPPYHYSTYCIFYHFFIAELLTILSMRSRLIIGLFGLIGIFGVALVPLFGRVIDRVVPWYGALTAIILLMCFQSVQLAAGGLNVAAPIIACLGIDLFAQMMQVSLSTSALG
jgi:MFS family permease